VSEVRVAWAGGGEARVVALSADAIVLRSTRPWPPGARVDGTAACDLPATLRVKVHTSKKQEDGSFVVEGRPIDMTREVRERIAAMLAGVSPARAADRDRGED
jgi:hypothetical protein